MMKVICSDIRWDTDGQEIDDLPTELTVEVLEVENVGDALSDETGWCHFGFHQQIVYHGYDKEGVVCAYCRVRTTPVVSMITDNLHCRNCEQLLYDGKQDKVIKP